MYFSVSIQAIYIHTVFVCNCLSLSCFSQTADSIQTNPESVVIESEVSGASLYTVYVSLHMQCQMYASEFCLRLVPLHAQESVVQFSSGHPTSFNPVLRDQFGRGTVGTLQLVYTSDSNQVC